MAKKELTPERTRILTAVGERIMTLMNGTIHTIEGIPTATVKYPDGHPSAPYRKLDLMPDQELQLGDVRVGKSGKIIFTFTPCDKRDWEAAEFDAKALDVALPLFGAELGQKIGSTAEAVPVLVDELVIEIEETERRAREEAAREAASLYENNPNYGRF